MSQPLPSPSVGPPVFDDAFRARLGDLFAWRRDVRRFRGDPVDEAVLRTCLDLAALAPSVGNSQPWRFVLVEKDAPRAAIRSSFEVHNKAALDGLDLDRLLRGLDALGEI